MNESSAERALTMEKINAAIANDDWEAAIELTKQVPLYPEVANAFKNVFGIEFLVKNGFDLSDAEKKYGKEWIS